MVESQEKDFQRMTLQVGRRSTVNSKLLGSISSADKNREHEDTSVDYIFQNKIGHKDLNGSIVSEDQMLTTHLQKTTIQQRSTGSLGPNQPIILEDLEGENRESRESGFQIAVVDAEERKPKKSINTVTNNEK